MIFKRTWNYETFWERYFRVIYGPIPFYKRSQQIKTNIFLVLLHFNSWECVSWAAASMQLVTWITNSETCRVLTINLMSPFISVSLFRSQVFEITQKKPGEETDRLHTGLFGPGRGRVGGHAAHAPSTPILLKQWMKWLICNLHPLFSPSREHY